MHITVNSVHPHVRGEYLTRRGISGTKDGSSPRAWGILLMLLVRSCLTRFIPTCVGNTILVRIVMITRTVHPHVRGEYSSIKHEEFLKVSIAAKIYRSGTA